MSSPNRSPTKSALARQGSMSRLHGPRGPDDNGSPSRRSKTVTFDKTDEIIQFDTLTPEIIEEPWAAMDSGVLECCESEHSMHSDLEFDLEPEDSPIRPGASHTAMRGRLQQNRPLPTIPSIRTPVELKRPSGLGTSTSDPFTDSNEGTESTNQNSSISGDRTGLAQTEFASRMLLKPSHLDPGVSGNGTWSASLGRMKEPLQAGELPQNQSQPLEAAIEMKSPALLQSPIAADSPILASEPVFGPGGRLTRDDSSILFADYERSRVPLDQRMDAVMDAAERAPRSEFLVGHRRGNSSLTSTSSWGSQSSVIESISYQRMGSESPAMSVTETDADDDAIGNMPVPAITRKESLLDSQRRPPTHHVTSLVPSNSAEVTASMQRTHSKRRNDITRLLNARRQQSQQSQQILLPSSIKEEAEDFDDEADMTDPGEIHEASVVSLTSVTSASSQPHGEHVASPVDEFDFGNYDTTPLLSDESQSLAERDANVPHGLNSPEMLGELDISGNDSLLATIPPESPASPAPTLSHLPPVTIPMRSLSPRNYMSLLPIPEAVETSSTEPESLGENSVASPRSTSIDMKSSDQIDIRLTPIEVARPSQMSNSAIVPQDSDHSLSDKKVFSTSALNSLEETSSGEPHSGEDPEPIDLASSVDISNQENSEPDMSTGVHVSSSVVPEHLPARTPPSPISAEHVQIKISPQRGLDVGSEQGSINGELLAVDAIANGTSEDIDTPAEAHSKPLNSSSDDSVESGDWGPNLDSDLSDLQDELSSTQMPQLHTPVLPDISGTPLDFSSPRPNSQEAPSTKPPAWLPWPAEEEIESHPVAIPRPNVRLPIVSPQLPSSSSFSSNCPPAVSEQGQLESQQQETSSRMLPGLQLHGTPEFETLATEYPDSDESMSKNGKSLDEETVVTRLPGSEGATALQDTEIAEDSACFEGLSEGENGLNELPLATSPSLSQAAAIDGTVNADEVERMEYTAPFEDTLTDKTDSANIALEQASDATSSNALQGHREDTWDHFSAQGPTDLSIQGRELPLAPLGAIEIPSVSESSWDQPFDTSIDEPLPVPLRHDTSARSSSSLETVGPPERSVLEETQSLSADGTFESHQQDLDSKAQSETSADDDDLANATALLAVEDPMTSEAVRRAENRMSALSGWSALSVRTARTSLTSLADLEVGESLSVDDFSSGLDRVLSQNSGYQSGSYTLRDNENLVVASSPRRNRSRVVHVLSNEREGRLPELSYDRFSTPSSSVAATVASASSSHPAIGVKPASSHSSLKPPVSETQLHAKGPSTFAPSLDPRHGSENSEGSQMPVSASSASLSKRPMSSLWSGQSMKSELTTRSAISESTPAEIAPSASGFSIHPPRTRVRPSERDLARVAIPEETTSEAHHPNLETKDAAPSKILNLNAVNRSQAALEHWNEKRKRMPAAPKNELGRLYVRLGAISDVVVPGINIGDNKYTYTMMLDNGTHCVTTPHRPIDAPINEEYVLSVVPDSLGAVEGTFRLAVSPSAEQSSEATFNNKSAPSTIAGEIGGDGSFARFELDMTEMQRQARGSVYSTAVVCGSQWSTNTNAGCRVAMNVMWLPRLSQNEVLPSSLDQAIAEIKAAHAERATGAAPHTGTLLQTGGDCPESKRRWFLLDPTGAILVAHSARSHRPRALINLSKANSVSLVQPTELVIKFRHGEEIRLEGNTDECGGWLPALDRVISAPHTRKPFLNALLYDTR